VEAGTIQVPSGLEGVVAFETEIAEPDKEGSALRYRGVDIEDLVGTVPFEQVWGLLVDGHYLPGLPPAEPHPLSVRSGDPRVDVQAALAQLAPEWGLGQLIDIPDEQARDDLARASVMALSFVAQSARGIGRPPVPQREIDKAASIRERFLIRWRVWSNRPERQSPPRCRRRSARSPAHFTAAPRPACSRCSTTWSARVTRRAT
jgi:citrate synthase